MRNGNMAILAQILALLVVPLLGTEQTCCRKRHFSSVQNNLFSPNFQFLSKFSPPT